MLRGRIPHADANNTFAPAGPVLDPMQQAYIAENVRGGAGPGRDPADPFANAGINFVEVKLSTFVFVIEAIPFKSAWICSRKSTELLD